MSLFVFVSSCSVSSDFFSVSFCFDFGEGGAARLFFALIEVVRGCNVGFVVVVIRSCVVMEEEELFWCGLGFFVQGWGGRR